MTNVSEKSRPTISIVTPSFNQGQYIEGTITSVLTQAGDFTIDYIIMDGGSTDNTVEIIKKYDHLLKESKWPIKCQGITFRWTSEKDKGQSDAINKGFRLASGDILGWLNSDDVFYPDALQTVAKLNWKKTDFCYGQGMWISHGGKDLCLYPTFKPNKYSLYYQCTLCQPTVFFSRKAWKCLGDFSLDYYCIFDYEYWMRAVIKGKNFRYIPMLIAKSRMYPENKSLSGQRTVEVEKARLLDKYYVPENMNKLMLFWFKRRVDTRTHHRVGILSAKLTESEKNENSL